MKHALFASILFALLAGPVCAAAATKDSTAESSADFAKDLDGTWIHQVERRGETFTESLILLADGNQLTGTLEDFRGQALPISDGKIDGQKLSFKVVRKLRDRSITEKFEGGVVGKEMSLTRSIEGGFGGGGFRGRRRGGFGGDGGYGGRRGGGREAQGPQVFTKQAPGDSSTQASQ